MRWTDDVVILIVGAFLSYQFYQIGRIDEVVRHLKCDHIKFGARNCTQWDEVPATIISANCSVRDLLIMLSVHMKSARIPTLYAPVYGVPFDIWMFNETMALLNPWIEDTFAPYEFHTVFAPNITGNASSAGKFYERVNVNARFVNLLTGRDDTATRKLNQELSRTMQLIDHVKKGDIIGCTS
eukprot:TRINITY_DN7108_c0_g3_i1.p1 TRINITY_DN7108_c0_g3~~TRINITY_DN7108_c0_g3_i1.p1  ORF type:complete len:183 (-),score=22.08 TRINITY_DN7108_c0_g3_i1:1040-1588(-)